jgi:striatin 1/3/4
MFVHSHHEKANFADRVKSNRQRNTEWLAEKQILGRELSTLLGRVAAINICRHELENLIFSLQTMLGLEHKLDLPSQIEPEPISPEGHAPNSATADSPIAEESVTDSANAKPAARRGAQRAARGKSRFSPRSDPDVGYTYRLKHELFLHLDCIRAITFFNSMPVLVSASDDGTIRLVHLEPKAPANRKIPRIPVTFSSLRGHGTPTLCLASFEYEGNPRLLSGALDGTIGVWTLPRPSVGIYDSHGLICHGRDAEYRLHHDAIWSIDVLGDLKTGISCSADGTVKVWSIGTGDTQKLKIADPPICCKSISEMKFAVGCQNGILHIFEGAVAVGKLEVCQTAIIKLEVYGDFVIAACGDAKIRCLDLSSMTMTSVIDGHGGGTNGMCVTADGQFLVTVGNDRMLNVWRMDSFDRVEAIPLNAAKYGEGTLCCAASLPSSGKFYFATAGAGGSLQVFLKT